MNPLSDDKPADGQPAEPNVSFPGSNTGDKPFAPKETGAAKPPVRRAAGSAVRRPGADRAKAGGDLSDIRRDVADIRREVVPPDTAKTVAFAVCGLLAVGILGMGGYLLLRNKPAVVVKAPLDHLSGDARELAEKAVKAEALYKEGKEKASATTLVELREADEKLTEANRLFNEIVDQNQTVAGFKDQIELAREKKISIDKDLRPIRLKIDELEGEERVNKLKAASGAKPPDGTAPVTPAPAVPTIPPGGKEPTEAELTDANLDRLFKDDPSEYERLAKFRHAKDPTYVIKKE